MPTAREMAEIEKITEAPVTQLLKRNHDFGEVDLTEIMISSSRSYYQRKDLERAGDLIRQCLKWVPGDRITANDALSHPFFE